jgi:hypothetical protein
MLCLVGSLYVLTVNAQETYKVGDKVELFCECYTVPGSWIPAVIEADLGSGYYKVRFGEGFSDYKSVSTQHIRDPKKGAAADRMKKLQKEFLQEAQDYYPSVNAAARLYDSTLGDAGRYSLPRTQSEWTKLMQDLEAVNQLCTTKYAGMKNPKDSEVTRSLLGMPATWCEIAANRASYQDNANSAEFQSKIDANVMFARNQIQRAIDEQRNSTSDDIQKLLFEPEKWKAELLKLVGAPATAKFPSSSWAQIQEKANELKSLIEQGAPSRSWEQPAFNRPVEQNMAKAKFLAYYPGSTVLKIGSSFGDWKMYKNSLGIPTNRFIRGWALLKIPGRPYCQAQEWIIKQTYKGGSWSASTVDSFGGGGVFMQCN